MATIRRPVLDPGPSVFVQAPWIPGRARNDDGVAPELIRNDDGVVPELIRNDDCVVPDLIRDPVGIENALDSAPHLGGGPGSSPE